MTGEKISRQDSNAGEAPPTAPRPEGICVNWCIRCGVHIPAADLACQRCREANEAEFQRIHKGREALNTEESIEFLLHELSIRKEVTKSGLPRLREVRDPGIARGRNKKNIQRILRKGREKLSEFQWFHRLCAVATQQLLLFKAVDPQVFLLAAIFKAGHEARYAWPITGSPPPSKRIKSFDEYLNGFRPKPSRGQAGREAAKKAGTTSSRSADRGAQARRLHQRHPELTEHQIADRLEPPLHGLNRDRTVRRYLRGR
jgi:hypothetical protein